MFLCNECLKSGNDFTPRLCKVGNYIISTFSYTESALVRYLFGHY